MTDPTVYGLFRAAAAEAPDRAFLVVPPSASGAYAPGGVNPDLCRGTGAHRRQAGRLCRRGLRPRPARRDPAGEPAGLPHSLAGAERAGRVGRSGQSLLPQRGADLSARPQRLRPGGRCAGARRRPRGGRRGGRPAPPGGPRRRSVARSATAAASRHSDGGERMRPHVHLRHDRPAEGVHAVQRLLCRGRAAGMSNRAAWLRSNTGGSGCSRRCRCST